jgi:hypothetical protein
MSPGPTAAPRRAPLRQLAPAVAIAAVYGAAAVAWLAVGRDALPGRWLALHLFTLGVLTNLVLALTVHFAATLLHIDASRSGGARLVLHNAGVVGVLVGLTAGSTVSVAVGATLATAAVTWAYIDLRRMRNASLGSRFAFVVRGYERACGAFIHGALLGALLGTGVLVGRWPGTARLAHVHVNLLGWGGLTLLATIVFFGPTMLRRRIADGADVRAPRALRWASMGLSVATIALLLTGLGGVAAEALRAFAAVGLAVYAVGATVIWRDVGRSAEGAAPSVERRLLLAVGGWFVVGIWLDVAVVATGAWAYLDVLGAIVLVGVLVQAIVAALVYLGPMLRGASADRRATLRARLQRLPRAKAFVLNAGVVTLLLAATALRDRVPASAAAGWALVAVAVVACLVPLLPGRPGAA